MGSKAFTDRGPGMEMQMNHDKQPKQPYQSPEIVDLGSVVATTTGVTTPVTDNPRSGYYDSSKSSRLPLNGENDEVDLGGRG